MSGTKQPNGMKRAFSAWNLLGAYDPRALPWAGMKQTFGLRDDGDGGKLAERIGKRAPEPRRGGVD